MENPEKTSPYPSEKEAARYFHRHEMLLESAWWTHYQQWLGLGRRVATRFGALYRHQARDRLYYPVPFADGRNSDIACGQIDIGNAATEMSERMAAGVLQANGHNHG